MLLIISRIEGMRTTAEERSSTGRNVSTSEMNMLSGEILVCGVAYDKASMAIPRWHREVRPDSRKSGRVSPSRVKHEITLKRHLPLHEGKSRKGGAFHRTTMKMRPDNASINPACSFRHLSSYRPQQVASSQKQQKHQERCLSPRVSQSCR